MICETVNSLMRQYGQEVEVIRAEETVSARAFLQPITNKQKQEVQYLPTPLGLRREDRFLYLGQPQVELKAGETRVGWNGQMFDIQSAHPIYVGRGLSHWWAVLGPADKEGA